ncbi:hypothetical protein CPB84DRAFT_1223948 [Gymnopilus junonius]|uniref:Uncharacterized protein n=1 Tax=Gymnopilus junonius TaxID=109634 RepID=A0A9P5TS26_GYMJU|nr:hypothetical protein CPB84DRAFT_1223948 [Gymnopilus junonius]
MRGGCERHHDYDLEDVMVVLFFCFSALLFLPFFFSSSLLVLSVHPCGLSSSWACHRFSSRPSSIPSPQSLILFLFPFSFCSLPLLMTKLRCTIVYSKKSYLSLTIPHVHPSIVPCHVFALFSPQSSFLSIGSSVHRLLVKLIMFHPVVYSLFLYFYAEKHQNSRCLLCTCMPFFLLSPGCSFSAFVLL